MSKFSPEHMKVLAQTDKIIANQQAILLAKNKDAARMHLLKIQQLLANKPLRS
jgi:hypothetical protein